MLSRSGSLPLPPSPPLLDDLQAALETFYRLDPAPPISDFLIPAAEHSREQLLIVEEEELFVGVAVEPASVATLQHELLIDANLDGFCLAVEGVSHFVCVMHRARHDRPTSILELELQAEVDKYVAALFFVSRCPSLPSERLRERLYEQFSLLDSLSSAERSRYRRANDLARRYARKLESRFVRRRQLEAMVRELRRFFRLTYRGKHDLIHRAA